MRLIRTKGRGKRKPHQKQSSRGTELMNYMELYCSPDAIAGSGISIDKKLERLAKRFPKNKFYQRLLFQRKPLTEKQIHAIALDYNLKYLNN